MNLPIANPHPTPVAKKAILAANETSGHKTTENTPAKTKNIAAIGTKWVRFVMIGFPLFVAVKSVLVEGSLGVSRLAPQEKEFNAEPSGPANVATTLPGNVGYTSRGPLVRPVRHRRNSLQRRGLSNLQERTASPKASPFELDESRLIVVATLQKVDSTI
jgi:hypothetical protein